MPKRRFVNFDYRLDDKRLLMLNNMDGKLKELHDSFQLLANETAHLFKLISKQIRSNVKISKKVPGKEGPEYTNVKLKTVQLDLNIQQKLSNPLRFVEEELDATLKSVRDLLNENTVVVNIDKKLEQEIMDLGRGNIIIDKQPFYQR